MNSKLSQLIILINKRTFIKISTIIYILVILLATTFPYDFSFDLISSLGRRASNIVDVFQNSTDFFDQSLNILLFLPFGFLRYWYCFIKKAPLILGFFYALLHSFSLSCSVETLQLLLPSRVPTLFDIFTNTLGGFIGALLFYLCIMLKLGRHKKKPYKLLLS